jgi:hypothetical protein
MLFDILILGLFIGNERFVICAWLHHLLGLGPEVVFGLVSFFLQDLT